MIGAGSLGAGSVGCCWAGVEPGSYGGGAGGGADAPVRSLGFQRSSSLLRLRRKLFISLSKLRGERRISRQQHYAAISVFGETRIRFKRELHAGIEKGSATASISCRGVKVIA